jgi:metal-sulfur cluster biosynthetic enzyme
VNKDDFLNLVEKVYNLEIRRQCEVELGEVAEVDLASTGRVVLERVVLKSSPQSPSSTAPFGSLATLEVLEEGAFAE